MAAQIVRQKGIVRRRELFEAAFSPEVLDALESWLGVKEAIFAFAPGADGKLEPLEACRVDTLMGVMRGIRFEIEHKVESQRYLEALIELERKGASHA